jgi:ferritin
MENKEKQIGNLIEGLSNQMGANTKNALEMFVNGQITEKRLKEMMIENAEDVVKGATGTIREMRNE